MRLSCPGCGAQYEVDAGAIPTEGREVQCSACGHTWFQYAPVTAPAFEAPVLPRPPQRPPEDFRALLREEAERETAERRREGVPPAPPSLPTMPPARRSGGFFAGMLLALVPLALLAALYVGAPRLEREAPALAPPLSRFVAQVDALRLWVDDVVGQVRAAR